MSMAKTDPEREERRRQQKLIADELKASGALDEVFARIDAGEPLTGHEGLLKGMLKASLERGLEVERWRNHGAGSPGSRVAKAGSEASAGAFIGNSNEIMQEYTPSGRADKKGASAPADGPGTFALIQSCC